MRGKEEGTGEERGGGAGGNWEGERKERGWFRIEREKNKLCCFKVHQCWNVGNLVVTGLFVTPCEHVHVVHLTTCF